MGADIHMVLEKRWRPSREAGSTAADDKWVGVNAFPYVKGQMYAGSAVVEGHVRWQVDSRNYDLFGAIAGVRREGPAPRGVPEDCSDLALMEIEAWDLDGHSHTWMLLSEALPLFIQHGQFGTADVAVLKAFRHGTEGALAGYVDHFYSQHGEAVPLDDYRLIMWFDN